MKRTVLSIMMVTVVLTVSIAQEKRYGIERAILKKNSVVESGDMKQTISSIQYFDDYGVKESAESIMNVAGQSFTILTMTKDGYAYSANMTTKQGSKIKMAAMMDDFKTVNYLNITDEVKNKYQIEEKGNEKFLGKDCKQYDLIVTVQGQSLKVAVWVWQGLPLKSSMTVVGNALTISSTTITEEVTEIQEGVAIEKAKFELPEGINFADVTPQM